MTLNAGAAHPMVNTDALVNVNTVVLATVSASVEDPGPTVFSILVCTFYLPKLNKLTRKYLNHKLNKSGDIILFTISLKAILQESYYYDGDYDDDD